MAPTFSTTKGIASTLLHIFVDRCGGFADPSRELAVGLIVNSGIGTPFGDVRIAEDRHPGDLGFAQPQRGSGSARCERAGCSRRCADASRSEGTPQALLRGAR